MKIEKTVETVTTVTKKREPMNTTEKVLIILALFLLAFIITMIVTFWVKGSVPDTLIQYTMGAGGIEAVLLAGIKISKIFKGKQEGESDENLDG